MRTTLNIDDKLLHRLKVAAADSGRTLSQIAEEALRAFFASRRSAPSKPIVLPVSRQDLNLRPGVNLDSNVSLAEAMDEEFIGKTHGTARR